MAQKIILKNSSTQGASPLVGDLDLGELAINAYDGKIFLKKNDGSAAIIDVTADPDYNKLINVPAEFTPEAHTHTESELTDLDRYTQANVDSLLDNKADLVNAAVTGNLAGLDAAGNLTDSGTSSATFATAAQGATADSAVQPGNGNSTLTNDSAYLVAADISGKADKTITILSNDTSLVTVANPTLVDDITLSFNTNQASGLVKIGLDGFIPVSLLPSTQRELIGSWDASGNTLPSDATTRGNYYVIEIAGTLTLARADDGVLEAIAVSPGDEITYTGRTGDWFYQVSRSVTTASAVGYDNTGDQIITSTNAQNALGDLDTEVKSNKDATTGLTSTKSDKVGSAVSGNFAGLDVTGNLTDSGATTATFATAAQGTKADTATQPIDGLSTLTNDVGYLTNSETIDGGTF